MVSDILCCYLYLTQAHLRSADRSEPGPSLTQDRKKKHLTGSGQGSRTFPSQVILGPVLLFKNNCLAKGNCGALVTHKKIVDW